MSRIGLGREKFLEEVWKWKAESGGAIVEQQHRLGASADWSRERFFTMDEGLSRAVTKTFVELYRHGLIYKDNRLVNWDPRLETAVSDLEVESDRAQRPRSLVHSNIRSRISRAFSSPWPPPGPKPCSAIPRSRCIPAMRATRAWWDTKSPFRSMAGRSHHRRRIFRSGKRHRRGQDHARPRLQ